MNAIAWQPALASAARWVFDTSWRAAVLIALVLLAQRVFRRWLTPRWRYALWLLVLARLLLPAAPESRVSVFGLAPPPPPVSAWAAASAGSGAGDPAPSGAAAAPRSPVTRAGFWFRALPGLWLAGAVALLARMVGGNLRLSARVARQRPVTAQSTLDVLEDAKQELRVRVPVSVVECDRVTGPALLGFVRPRLLLPPPVVARFTRDELRLALLHEVAHVRRRDVLLNGLMAVLYAVHWFNPLVWLAWQRMRRDAELACDSLVLSFGRERENEAYGRTMLKVLEGSPARPLVPGAVGILEDGRELKRRMTMIAQHTRHQYGVSWLAAALLLVLGFTTFTRPVAGEPAREPTAPDLSGVTAPLNLDFELGTVPGAGLAARWMGGGDGYELTVDNADPHGGVFAGKIHNTYPGAQGFGTYTSRLPPDDVAGRRVRFSGWLKLKNVSGFAGLWMRADRQGQAVAFDNMQAQQLGGTREWAEYRIELEIPEGADNINFGALLAGGGTLWIDDLRVEIAEPGAPRAASGAAPADIDYAPVLAAMEAWFQHSDALDASGTYGSASRLFQHGVSQENWATALQAARAPLGKVLSRTVASQQHLTSLPGAPDGAYAVIQYNTHFEKKQTAFETCTLVREPDGAWRVAGYFIR